jgi:hypothetical protein
MRNRIRRTTLAGTAAGLTLVLAAPFTGAANATDLHGRGGRETGVHGWHSLTNPAEHTAVKALRAAIMKATSQYRLSVHRARAGFRHDPVVIKATADRRAIVRTSTNPQTIQDANAAFILAVATPKATLDAAITAATTAWITSVDAAYTAYDTATDPAHAAAAATFRNAVRVATTTLRASVRAADTRFRTDTAHDRAVLRAAVNAAEATFIASKKTPADRHALHQAIIGARTVFAAATAPERTTRTATMATARTTYQAAIKKARDGYFAATGHSPYRGKPVLPRV